MSGPGGAASASGRRDVLAVVLLAAEVLALVACVLVLRTIPLADPVGRVDPAAAVPALPGAVASALF